MKRLLALCAGLALAAVPPVSAGTSVQIGVTIGNAPPPPVVVFDSRPHFAYVQGVYVIDDDEFDYDMFRCGRFYYVYNNGWWYRARSYRGPFVVVQTRSVPRAIFAVGDRHYRWKQHPHGMPPGQAKKLRAARHVDYDDHGHGRGRGHKGK